MQEVSSDRYQKMFPLFEKMDHHLSIRAVLEGVMPGRVYMSDSGESALAMTPQNFLFGGRPDACFCRACAALLRDELLPMRAKAGKLDYVVFFPDGWLETVTESLRDLRLMPSRRMTWSLDMGSDIYAMPSGVQRVTPELLSRGDLKGIDWTCEEILGGWPTVEAFHAGGFGCVAIEREPEGERIIAWSLTDWAVGDRCEIGVEVQPEYRMRGIGTRVVLGTLALAAKKGMKRVDWQCWEDNRGSQGVARAAGLRMAKEFPVLFGWNLPLNNALINGNYYMTGRPEYGVPQDIARSASSYAEALDQGWDWGGEPSLYYNAACIYYRLGETERARKYFTTAVEKGFTGLDAYRGKEWWKYVYHEPDAEEIIQALS